MKKILTIFILCFCLCLCLCTATPSLAAEAIQSAPEEAAPITALLAAFFTENADTLLGILTLLGSVLVAFLYKKGLLPLVRSGLSALAELLGKTGDVTEKFTKDASGVLSRIEEQTAPILTALTESQASLLALGERLSAMQQALERSEADRKSTAAVLTTETELFYELLSSVNLPQAQKDSMTESYYRMKRLLEEQK